MSTQSTQIANFQTMQKQELNKRLETIGWGLFLIMIGGLWLVPGTFVPEGAWLIGAGLIMLGLNAARYLNGLPLSEFTIFLGTIALLFGVGDFLQIELPLFPILLILVGANILLKPLFEKE